MSDGPTLSALAAVASGGALGASLRWATANVALRIGGEYALPSATMIVNLVGCLLMGVALAALAKFAPENEEIRLFVLVGALGGFTTFSAFSNDAVAMIQRGEILAAGVYVSTSTLGSIAALAIGLAIAKAIIR